MAVIDRRVGWLFLAFAALLVIALLRALDLGILQGRRRCSATPRPSR